MGGLSGEHNGLEIFKGLFEGETEKCPVLFCPWKGLGLDQFLFSLENIKARGGDGATKGFALDEPPLGTIGKANLM